MNDENRTEVSWDDGKGRQPYANRGEVEQGPAAAPEVEGGDRGDTSGRNSEQLEEARQVPGRPDGEAPRGA